jgi:ubiquinone/menaquinone biosynthesis C-methylase UbiE
MPAYGDPAFWEERYGAEPDASFDWYQPYDTLRPFLMPYLSVRPDFEVLVAGCGNSALPAQLSDDGFENISCVDVSQAVVDQMSKRYAGNSDLDYWQADMTSLDVVPNESFDVVFDKALLDALLCGEESFDKALMMLGEVHRVLKPGGRYICVSYGIPSSRQPLLEHCTWAVESSKIPKPPVAEFQGVEADPNHFLYVCRK